MIDTLNVHNMTANTTRPGGSQFQTWTAEGAPHNRQKTLNCVHACVYVCAGMCVCIEARMLESLAL